MQIPNNTCEFQTERSFQKQPTVFLNRKKGIGVKRSRKPLRYHKDVGLGFKTPREVTHGVINSVIFCLDRESVSETSHGFPQPEGRFEEKGYATS